MIDWFIEQSQSLRPILRHPPLAERAVGLNAASPAAVGGTVRGVAGSEVSPDSCCAFSRALQAQARWPVDLRERLRPSNLSCRRVSCVRGCVSAQLGDS